MELRLIFMAIVCLCIAQMAFAIDESYPFKNVREQRRFVQLTKQLRCPTCKSQSLFEANSTTAIKMREQMYYFIVDGMSDRQIRSHFVNQFGEQVLLHTPWHLSALFLWIWPLILFGICWLNFKHYFSFNKTYAASAS